MLTVAGILGCLALPSGASESFILNIPLRSGASQETGRVNITLTLAGPAAGAQLVVDSSTTLTLGQPFRWAPTSSRMGSDGVQEVKMGSDLCSSAIVPK